MDNWKSNGRPPPAGQLIFRSGEQMTITVSLLEAKGRLTLKVFTKTAGTEAQISTAAVTFTAGASYQIIVYLAGSLVQPLTRALASGRNFRQAGVVDTFQQTESGAKVVCAGTIANFQSWPRSITAPTFVPTQAPLVYFAMGDSKTFQNVYQPYLTPASTQNRRNPGQS